MEGAVLLIFQGFLYSFSCVMIALEAQSTLVSESQRSSTIKERILFYILQLACASETTKHPGVFF